MSETRLDLVTGSSILAETRSTRHMRIVPLRSFRPMLRIILLVFCGACTAMAQSHQLDFVTGYNYQNSDEGKGLRSNLNGWYASLQYDLNDTIAITAEIDNYYGALRNQYLNQQNYVAGPQFTFRSSTAKLRPFIFIEVGDQRSSGMGNVTHSFDLQIGGGVELQLQDRISLQFTPGQYNLAFESGNPTHSYSANVGIVWTLWKQK